jgi:hypothetical protein
VLLSWFSQEEPNWNSIIRHGRKVFEQNGYKLHDWQNCSVSAFSTDSGKVRVNVRRRNIQYSMYMKRNIAIKFLYGFDISSIEEPIIEKYDQSSGWRSDDGDGQEFRWVIPLKKEGNQHLDRRDCSIWQCATAQGEIRQSDIFHLFRYIEMKLKSSSNCINLDNVDDEDTEPNDQVIPVIVQPSADGWKNFVRQVHSAKLDNFEEEFTLVFNDEHLRKYGILESFYRFLRPFLYYRLTDLESFRVILEGNAASYFVFPGIYSGKSDVMEDSVHGDRGRFF